MNPLPNQTKHNMREELSACVSPAPALQKPIIAGGPHIFLRLELRLDQPFSYSSEAMMDADQRKAGLEVGVINAHPVVYAYKMLLTIWRSWMFARAHGLPANRWFGVYVKGSEIAVAHCGCMPGAEQLAREAASVMSQSNFSVEFLEAHGFEIVPLRNREMIKGSVGREFPNEHPS